MTTDVMQMELRMNVAALKRVDPYLKDILESASHVALYAFNGNNNEWEKTEIEGALFIYSRMGEPYHSILIMNRYFVLFFTPALFLISKLIVLIFRLSFTYLFIYFFVSFEFCQWKQNML